MNGKGEHKQSLGNTEIQKKIKEEDKNIENIDLYMKVLVYQIEKHRIDTFFTNHTPKCQIYFHTTFQLLEFECKHDLQNQVPSL